MNGRRFDSLFSRLGIDLLEFYQTFSFEVDPKRWIFAPDHRRYDCFFDLRQILDERTSLMKFLECLEKDLNDFQEWISVKIVNVKYPLKVVIIVAVSIKDQEQRQAEKRLDEFVVEEKFSIGEKRIDGNVKAGQANDRWTDWNELWTKLIGLLAARSRFFSMWRIFSRARLNRFKALSKNLSDETGRFDFEDRSSTRRWRRFSFWMNLIRHNSMRSFRWSSRVE